MEALESELTCPVCLELYNTPLLLPCLHNLCQRCAEEILLSAQKKPDGEEEKVEFVESDEDKTEDEVAEPTAEATNAPETASAPVTTNAPGATSAHGATSAPGATSTPETTSAPEATAAPEATTAPEREEDEAEAEVESTDEPTQEEDCDLDTPAPDREIAQTAVLESDSAEGASPASSPDTDNGNKTPTSQDIEDIKTNIAESQEYLKAALKFYENGEELPVEEAARKAAVLDEKDLDEGIQEEEATEDAVLEDFRNVEFESGRGLESLRRNITLENIIERYRDLAKGTKPSPVLCDVCDADPPPTATKTCLTCQISYCDNCVRTTHPSNKKAFTRHKLVEPQQAKRKVLTCPDHEDEKLNMFCCVDEMPICALCKLVGKHSEHKVAALAQMYRQKKESVANSVSRLEQELQELGVFVTKVKQTITELERNSDGLKSHLSSAIEELCRNLQNRRDAMLREVEQEKEVQLELLQVELATHEDQVKKMDALMMYANEALKEEDHASFLQQESLHTGTAYSTMDLTSGTHSPYNNDSSSSVREVDGRIGQSLLAIPERATQASILFDSFLLNLDEIRQQVTQLGFLAGTGHQAAVWGQTARGQFTGCWFSTPGPVEILREACHATSGKAILHWQPKTKGVVDSYTITCLIKTLSWTEEIAKVTCPQPYQIFTDLRPSTKYIFQICANNKCGPSPPETVELFTKPPLPLVLQAGNATGSSIQIKWCDYNLGDLKIIFYLLSYRLAARSSYQIQTNDDWGEISNIMGLEYILDGLNSRSRYDVKVTALYQAGTSVTSEVFQYWTRGM
ncbi:hypothetical protein Bbelb_215160 [Branchiostoma belcheri]|nr:hypothetical protein Bbelb_215160 [Branchiostoma belcheri]